MMLKHKKGRIFLVFLLILLMSPPKPILGEAEIVADTQDKLNSISDEEKDILETLYTMEQEINTLSVEVDTVQLQIESDKGKIAALDIEIQKEETSYANNRDTLKEILKSYQRLGPGTFLEILLDSDSLATFLRRINTLRDLTRNTGELMDSLKASKEKLKVEKEERAEKLVLVEEQQKQLQDLLYSKIELKNEKETYLASLQDQRAYYEGFLKDITQAWTDLKPVFTEAANEFSRLAEAGSLPEDALDISFTLENIKGTIKEKAFNEVIIDNPEVPNMLFTFTPGKIELSVPTKNLVLYGNFTVEGINTLKFVAEEGTFYDLPLEKGTIEELFEEGYLFLKLEPLIGKNIVEKVESKEGKLELLIKLSLF